MPLISWNDSFALRIDIIDRQHQMLVGMINSLYDALHSGEERSALAKQITKMSNYAAFHFAKEEEFFEVFGFPEAKRHMKEHTDFEDKVTRFESEFESGKTELSVEVLQFLGNWLVEHIKGSDQRYGSFLKARGLN